MLSVMKSANPRGSAVNQLRPVFTAAKCHLATRRIQAAIQQHVVIPGRQRHQVAIQQSMSKDPGNDGVFCFKTHRRIQPVTNEMRVICPYRDVRDAMLSYMRFMKCPFDRALKAAVSMMENTDHYLQQKKRNILPLRYESIVHTPQDAVKSIAQFLQLNPGDSAYKQIASDLSKNKVKQYLDELDQVKVEDTGQFASGNESAQFTSLQRLDGSYRIYDYSTGFQSNHITSGKDGEWKEYLDAAQKKKLLELTSQWLQKYRFPI